jgi:hypothetical protein
MMTKQFSAEQFSRARSFLLESGRPLEAAVFRYRFEGSDAEPIYAALEHYRNADGGFGHALEPDLRTPASSVLATTTALQTLRMLHTPASHPLVQGAIRYLETTFDQSLQSWPLAPPDAEHAAHAPWWNQEGLGERFGSFTINPRAEVLGYLYEFADETDTQAIRLRETLTPIVLQDLPARTEGISGDAFLCCQRLIDSPGLPSDAAVDLQRWLLRVADGIIATEPSSWSGYVLLPLQVAPNRAAPMGIPLAHVLPENLDFVIATQNADGSWSPTWSWFGAFPDEWPQAERDWRSVLTLERLEWLHAYDRIAHSSLA